MVLTDNYALDILRIPVIADIPAMYSVYSLYRRLESGKGCAGCRKRHMKPAFLAPSLGAALKKAVREGYGDRLHAALTGAFGFHGPVTIRIGGTDFILNKGA